MRLLKAFMLVVVLPVALLMLMLYLDEVWLHFLAEQQV